MENNFRLFDTNDSISFGQMKNEPFKWIYLLATPYLVWLIEKTDICFSNLELFYTYGERLKIDKNTVPKAREKDFQNLIEEHGHNHYSGNSKAYLITIDLYAKALQGKIFTLRNFKKEKFEFSAKTIEINNSKLHYAEPEYNLSNLERDNYLKVLFKI